ncbi:AAA family ATPase [Gemmata sp. JC717]|uniref:AAA domain-containing protein n=1 Tax=Gemmata algarum TaxID=2975278 RepID=UPI0021BB040E|nr:AAA domain-containing protein [Gemmata algarum]MDY3556217.1 AAA family ATPase [Gemmata algarum]
MNAPSGLTITATDLGEYVRHHSCDRRFHLAVHAARETEPLPFFDRLRTDLDPVLAELGRQRENQWEAELIAAGFRDLAAPLPKGKRDEVTWAAIAAVLEALPPGASGYARQVAVGGTVGAFRVYGLIDFMLVKWTGAGPVLVLVECKASRRDRTYHRVQVTAYRVLLRGLLGGRPVVIGGAAVAPEAIECVVARLDPERNTTQSILALPALDLAHEEADLVRLLAPGGRLDAAASRPLAELGFQIDTKCDGCTFAPHCMAESARLRQVELLGIDPVTTRLLRGAGLGTLDQLANPPMFEPKIEALARDPGFTESLDVLRLRARARLHTLPVLPGTRPVPSFGVEPVPNTGVGHLPPHEANGTRLLRVYLAVDYDYTENRVGALAAHVTRGPQRIDTPFADGAPVPGVQELTESGKDRFGKPVHECRPLHGEGEVVEFQPVPWSGMDYAADTAAEGELIRRFFDRLAGVIARVAGGEPTPVHFYVWSRSDVRYLIEGCCRAGPELLGPVRQLFGCREGLEQQMYSAVREEVNRRYALGWTGRGLGVVASLEWSGRRFHWTRAVNGAACDLSRVFAQGIFDFVADLDIAPNGDWTAEGSGVKHTFEVRARFGDGLPAPYWHAVWGTLPDSDPRAQEAVTRYRVAGAPGLLEAYLLARVQALRWLEEGIGPKNPGIEKAPLDPKALPAFKLGRDGVARAATDFLRLDQHVRRSDWVAMHLVPPIGRVPAGRTLPLKQVKVGADKSTITGVIELFAFGGLKLADLEARCQFGPGAFARLSPWNGDPKQGQAVAQLTSAVGRTCVVRDVNWKTGQVTLDAMYAEEDRYLLSSGASKKAEVLFDRGYATLDENVSDYVAGRVDERLQRPSHVYAWFDPVDPRPPVVPPLPDAESAALQKLLDTFLLPPGGMYPASPDQARAAVDGLSTRVQLIQGPPGTGKTTTTALAVLLRVLVAGRPGDVVLLSAHTHTALDNLLERIDRYLEPFRTHAAGAGRRLLPVRLVKVHTNDPSQHIAGGAVENIPAALLGTKKKLTELSAGGVAVIGGTTAGLLKLAPLVEKLKTYNGGEGLQTSLLVVDEASMMVFPHFLALATLVAPKGQILLAGDHRQLAPITAHDWEAEDRPPAVLYQPFASAYDAVRRIIDAHVPAGGAMWSGLRLTFRLPPVVRELIGRIYRKDRIELAGLLRAPVAGAEGCGGVWSEVWRWNVGLFLAIHDEAGSRRSNQVEVSAIEALLAAAPPLPAGSVAVITPHRAQRSLLATRLAAHTAPGGAVGVIDTVERLQGGERPTVIVSGTVSDPTAVAANAGFVLNLNRANVAFSRVQDRLVVVCSRALLDHIPAEVEHYESAALWKALRDLCSELVGEVEVCGHGLKLYRPPAGATPV